MNPTFQFLKFAMKIIPQDRFVLWTSTYIHLKEILFFYKQANGYINTFMYVCLKPIWENTADWLKTRC